MRQLRIGTSHAESGAREQHEDDEFGGIPSFDDYKPTIAPERDEPP
jgi:hypothetical protein